MIVLQCWKCGECSYLELKELGIIQKKTICKACGKPKVNTKVFKMPEPYGKWERQ